MPSYELFDRTGQLVVLQVVPSTRNERLRPLDARLNGAGPGAWLRRIFEPMERTEKTYSYPEVVVSDSMPHVPVRERTSHEIMVRMVGGGKRVLEFGCANGYMSQMLAAAGCRVVGVELNAAMAAEARAYCDEVVVGDLDSRALDDLLPERSFDVLVFGDVLEHLSDPWRVLDESRHFVAAGGFVVLSIPNVAHGSIRLALLAGSFDYAEAGLLDDTHIRFFTHQSIVDLCARAGYRIESIERTTAPIFSRSPLMPNVEPGDFDPAVVEMVARDPEAQTFQFVVKATPLDDAKKRDALYKQLVAARTELDAQRHDAREASRAERARADDLQHRLNLEAAHTTQQAGRIAVLDDDRDRTARALADIVARYDEVEGNAEAATDTLARVAALFTDQRTRLRESAATIARLERDRGELAIAHAEMRIELANRTLERDLADGGTRRAAEVVDRAQAELETVRAKLGDVEVAFALARADREHVDTHRLAEIAALRQQLGDVTTRADDRHAAYLAKDAEFAALGVLHRSLADTDHARTIALRTNAIEIDRLSTLLAAEYRTHAATRSVFSEFLAFESANARHQTATVQRMIATYQSSKWWSLKRLLRRKGR